MLYEPWKDILFPKTDGYEHWKHTHFHLKLIWITMCEEYRLDLEPITYILHICSAIYVLNFCIFFHLQMLFMLYCKWLNTAIMDQRKFIRIHDDSSWQLCWSYCNGFSKNAGCYNKILCRQRYALRTLDSMGYGTRYYLLYKVNELQMPEHQIVLLCIYCVQHWTDE